MEPSISVIIPAYNAASYLGEAIESVLSQSYLASQIIVVNDGSTDTTAAVASRYKTAITYIEQNNAGTGAARNTAIAQADGDFVAFLDADDFWPPYKLEHQLAVLLGDPNIDIVTGLVQQFFSPDISAELRAKTICPIETRPGHISPAMLIRRSALIKLGDFKTHFNLGVDMEWFIRMRDLELCLVTLPEVVLWRRIHAHNNGRIKRDFAEERVHILKAAIDMRRERKKAVQESP